MKSKVRAILILLLGILVFGAILGLNQVKASDTPLNITIKILDNKGNQLAEGYGSRQWINEKSEELVIPYGDYSDFKYYLYSPNNYGERINTEFGTFIYKEKSNNNYIYTASIDTSKWNDLKGEYTLIYYGTNEETKEEDTLNSKFYFGYSEFIDIYVSDDKGNDISYGMPESGGGGLMMKENQDYSNANFKLCFEKNYGNAIKTPFGIFNLKETKKIGECTYYYYTCSVDTNKLIKGPQNYYYLLEEKGTGNVDLIYTWVCYFKSNLTNKSNLAVNGTYIIKNGNYIENENTDFGEGYYVKDGVFAVYRELYGESDELYVDSGKNVDIYYSNMGPNFRIELAEGCTANITSENIDTGIILDSIATKDNNNDKAIELAVDKVTKGEEYNTVEVVLKDKVEKFVAYDITLERAGIAVQPDGNVKISIPIPDGYDTSKLVVYRVDKNGIQNKYDVKVETINNQKYAVFETNHFSTYVLAEEKTQNINDQETNIPNTDNNTNTVNNELDETPKTGTVEFVNVISVIALISLVGIALLNKKNK